MIVGIDLGTTNSAIAIWRDGTSMLVPNSLGHVLTPSAVSVEDNGDVLVGLAARERQVSHPDRTSTAFKRHMGTQRRVQLGPVAFTPEELSAVVLRSLKADAEAFLGEPVTEAVIAVPAYFNDKQRKATRRAGELAGLKVERLVNEPTAAALAFGIADRERETRFLVFDLGGGTFDVSILEVFEGVLEVRASAGDNRLGGEDFNAVLADHVRSRLAARWGEATSGAAFQERVRAAAERTRRALSDQAETELTVTWAEQRETVTVTGEDFERLSEGLLDRMRKPVLRALADGRLRLDQLDEIVLVGGATRMPIVRRAVTRMFGRFPSNAVDAD